MVLAGVVSALYETHRRAAHMIPEPSSGRLRMLW